MSNNYLISIIIPVYNVEPYLSNTIESIIEQSINFKNIELILVDDKSTDNSKKIMDEYSSKYSNIKSLSMDKNSGYPGNVRNKGLKIATGKYIMFMDSDDEYEKNICEVLYKTLIKYDCDCVRCNYKFIDPSINENTANNINLEEIEVLNPEIALSDFNSFVWNKIFKRKIIEKNNIKFVSNCVGEDTYFCIEYYLNSNRIIHLKNYYGYKYFNRESSFSTKKLKWVLDIINHNQEQLKRLNKISNINLYEYTDPSFYILCAMTLIDNDWNSLSTLLNRIYFFEKTIKFNNNKKLMFRYRFVNYFIIKNHITIATFIIYIMNRLLANIIIRKTYRKFINILKKN